MKSTLRRPIRALALLQLAIASFILIAATSCSRTGTAKLESADTYFTAGDYDKAEIEYKNLFQANAQDAHAIARLGTIYLEQGRLRQAVPFLFRARELQPDNLEIRNSIGALYYSFGKFKEAQAEAEYILAREPSDENAALVLVQSLMVTPEGVAAAEQRLKELPETASTITALGLIQLRRQNVAAAESAFQRAVSMNPKLVAAHVASAALYRAKADKAATEQALKTAADLAPIRSGRALQYAQFKFQTGDRDGGMRLLEELTQKAPDYLPPLATLAELAASEKRFDDSAALVTKILARDSLHPEATLLNGRLKLQKGQHDKAIIDFEKVLGLNPSSPQALYFLGLAHAASGEKTKAVDRLNQAIKISPMPEAILALATLNLRSGDYSSVVGGLRPFVEKYKSNIQAQMMLADAYRAQGNFDEALEVCRAAEKEFPANPQPSFQIGLTLLQQKKPADARAAFTESLRRAPEFFPALEMLVNLDLAGQQYDAALGRLAPTLERDPKSAVAHLLLGRVHALKGDAQQAEAEFQQAIELRPEVPTAYFQLAQLYLTTNQQQKALTSLKSVVDRNPSDMKAWLLTGVIQDQQKNYEAARDAYEKVIGINPKSTLALNNLAYLYSERFNDQEKAYAAAQKARELSPGEPHTADTLGWILYKRGQYSRALILLEESAAGLPNESEIQYHLGLTQYMSGLEEPSRQAFERALELKPDISSAAEIRRRLAVLAIDRTASNPETIAALEKALADSPDDPIALARLAALHEHSGSIDKAILSYQAAIKVNPASSSSWMGLARLYSSRKDAQKALEAAKTARKLAPDDPAVTRALASLAHQMGDSVWAASLLQEAARRQPDDRELLFETAQVVYSVGQVEEARSLLQEALAPVRASGNSLFKSPESPAFSKAEQARQFLEMMDLAAKPDPAAAPRIEGILKNSPTDAPALMALGAIQEQKSDTVAARRTYETVLTQFAGFTPAKLRLALLSLPLSEVDPKAFEWAQQSRSAYPDDPDAAKALGILTYRKAGDMTHVVSLLKQSTAERESDAESFYYLGMAQLQTKDLAGGRQSLEKGIALGLRPELLSEARKQLEPAK
jgi:tetratricopeptide (TPR) repeat protein